jgi:radical SAM protein with 4Fe4S-binding SPASM domain
LAKDAYAAGTLTLLITGGEPLLREDFPEIYSALSQMGFIITLYTNATLITPEIIRLFSRYPPTATAVTVYGSSPETYGKICGDGGAFEKMLHGLELLKTVPTELEIRTTFIKDNKDELDSIRSLANRFTNRYAINLEVYKPPRGATSDVTGCRLSPAEITALKRANVSYYDNLISGVEGTAPADEPDGRAGRDLGFSLPPLILQCLAAKAMYWITWDGKMLPCGTFTTPYTLPLQEGFAEAWARLPQLCEAIRMPAQCLSCEFRDSQCPNCPAILYSETGSYDQVPPYICEIARERNRLKT